MVKVIVIVLSLFALCCVVSSQECDQNPPWIVPYPQYSGSASWFNATSQSGDAPETGACGWVKSSTDINVGAYTAPTTSGECKLCGNCYNVTGSAGSLVTRVVEYCDTSQTGGCGLNVAPQWTLHYPAFQKVCGDLGQGSAPVSWYGPIPCPITQYGGNLLYTGSSGDNVWYVALKIDGQRTPIQTVLMQSPGAGPEVFFNVSRHQGNVWWSNPTVAQTWPFKIMVIDVAGNVVNDTIQAATMNGTPQQGTGGNFPLPPAPASSSTPTRASASPPSSSASKSPAAPPSSSNTASKPPAAPSASSVASNSPAAAIPSSSTVASKSPAASSSTVASKSHVTTPSSVIVASKSAATAAATSSKPAKSKAASSAPPKPQLQSLVVYNDSVVSGFNSWTWATTYSYTNTNPVYAGSNSISYNPTASDALYFTCTGCFNTSFYAISFYVNGGATGGQRLQVQVVNSDHQQVGANYVFTVTANQWQAQTVILSTLNVPASVQLGGFWIQSYIAGSASQGLMYLDQIVILASSGSATVNMPPITSSTKKRGVNTEQDIVDALEIVFPDIKTWTVESQAERAAAKRDVGATVINAVGLNQDQIDAVGSPADWIPSFNAEAGTDVDPAQVVVRVVQPTSAVGSEIVDSSSMQQGSVGRGDAARNGMWLAALDQLF